MSEVKVFTARLDPAQARKIELIARADAVSVNDAFRTAIDHYIALKRSDADFVKRIKEILAEDAEVAQTLSGTS